MNWWKDQANWLTDGKGGKTSSPHRIRSTSSEYIRPFSKLGLKISLHRIIYNNSWKKSYVLRNGTISIRSLASTTKHNHDVYFCYAWTHLFTNCSETQPQTSNIIRKWRSEHWLSKIGQLRKTIIQQKGISLCYDRNANQKKRQRERIQTSTWKSKKRTEM